MTVYCGACKQPLETIEALLPPEWLKCKKCGFEVYEVPDW